MSNKAGFTLIEMILVLTLLSIVSFVSFKAVLARPTLKTSVAEMLQALRYANSQSKALNTAVEVQLSQLSSTPVLNIVKQSDNQVLYSETLSDTVTLSLSPTFDTIVFHPTSSIQLQYLSNPVSHSSDSTLTFTDSNSYSSSITLYYYSGVAIAND
ncbi:MAG: prepilin-type N-terminal cleavage/methylation domain-containing protein [bacterium]